MLIPKQPQTSSDIAGFNNKRHLESLGDFIKKLPEGSRVLEIGVGWGGSTWEILDNLPERSEMHSCDTFQMNDNATIFKHTRNVMAKNSHNSTIAYQMNIYKDRGQREAFEWGIKQHSKYYKFMKKIHECKSLTLLKKDLNWDCVYIDGLHSYENVSKELDLLKHVKYLCGDDFHPAHPGCMQAISEFNEKVENRTFWHDPFESGSGFWYSIAE